MIGDLDVGTEMSAPVFQPPTMDAGELARIVDQHVAALWRGHENVDHEFFGWLTSWWGPSTAPEPDTPPTAVSVLGAGGAGIRWYQTATGCVGYVEGRPGCYRVPASAAPPGPAIVRTSHGANARPISPPQR